MRMSRTVLGGALGETPGSTLYTSRRPVRTPPPVAKVNFPRLTFTGSLRRNRSSITRISELLRCVRY